MKRTIIWGFSCLFFLACTTDPLDITPDGRMSIDDVFASEIQAEAYLNTVYLSIPTYFVHYSGWSWLAGLTDEARDSETGNQPSMASSWVIGSLTPSYNPMAQPGSSGRGQDRYTTFWQGIRDANVFLSYIDGVSYANDEKKQRQISEAKLLRAFFYFELIKQFGPMPIVTEPFTPTFDYTQLTRPSFQQCINFIVDECDQVIASPDLPIRITIGNERGRFSKAVAFILKSQSLLYNASPLWNPENSIEKWSAAASAAKEGLDALLAGGQYRLADDYGDYFLNASDINVSPRDRETIFEIKDGDIPLTTTGLPSKVGSWMIGSVPSQELVDSYDMQSTGMPAILGYEDADHLIPIVNNDSGYDEANPYVDRDPRFYATVWYNGAAYDNINGKVHTVETFVGGADQLIKSAPNRINTHTGYYLRKFIDPSLAINQMSAAKFKKYRLAELYLNFAEAENEVNGPTNEVYEAINAIRNRADMPDLPAALDRETMRNRIRRERRVEMVWEEHRFWDVRRWKILDQTDKLVTGMEIRQTGGGKVNISNPGFEDGNQGWTFQGEATVQTNESHAGGAAVEMPNGGHIFRTVNVTPNTDYMLSVWVNATAEWGLVGVRDHGYAEANAMQSAGGGWVQKTVRFTTGPTTETATIFSWWPGGSAGFVDDFELARVAEGGGTSEFSYNRFVVERRNAWQDKFLIFPIPITDASIVPDFRLNQNPGW
ncbi:MAG: RagB/SusD family nutrient uptake outer membrane protein [Parapedobacter sp.]|nr:MAG: RagB/SusD family nutrient uptake outer membrane protein [Parapedobacter sp.]